MVHRLRHPDSFSSMPLPLPPPLLVLGLLLLPLLLLVMAVGARVEFWGLPEVLLLLLPSLLFARATASCKSGRRAVRVEWSEYVHTWKRVCIHTPQHHACVKVAMRECA
mgnify:CR=1 FL=1